MHDRATDYRAILVTVTLAAADWKVPSASLANSAGLDMMPSRSAPSEDQEPNDRRWRRARIGSLRA
jgi:hypothetical protein